MEPVIRNVKDVFDGTRARLVNLDDNPPTCTMTYSEIQPGGTSSHHIHEWEHEVYIIQGSGTLICDGKEYPVKEGAAQSGGAQNDGGQGTGQPPVIRNHSELDRKLGHVLIGGNDGADNYVMLHNDPMAPGAVSHPETGGHTHEWEHVVYMLEGTATFVCDGNNYTLNEGDAMLVPPNALHQWKNESSNPVIRVTYNPSRSESAEH